MSRIHVIMLAGGSGSRMGMGVNKVLLSLAGKSILRRSMEAFFSFADQMIIVCRPEEMEAIRKEAESPVPPFPILYANGGATRQDSVFSGLSLLTDRLDDIVLIHDAARCLIDSRTIWNVIHSVLRYGNGIASIPVTDTIKTCRSDGLADQTLPRDQLRAAQTPQGFFVGELLQALTAARKDGFIGTDDASVLEHYGKPVHLTEGNAQNIKITVPEDLITAENRLSPCAAPVFRIGQGYDVHALTAGRDLILCGVKIPYEFGLEGHSDADVALHALMDAMLGAASLGDIGRHFPDSDAKYKGISSMLLLEHVVHLLQQRHWAVSNVDLTIVAQKPKLAPYIPDMVRGVSAALSVPEHCVNIKATTTEHLGFEGRMEGISAQAVCLICRS